MISVPYRLHRSLTISKTANRSDKYVVAESLVERRKPYNGRGRNSSQSWKTPRALASAVWERCAVRR